MTEDQMQKAAALLAEARGANTRIGSLPDDCRPATVPEALAIQDAVTALLGRPVPAFKAGVGTRGAIYDVYDSPACVSATLIPQCGVEGEVAFIFRRDLPPGDYTRAEIAAAVDACVTIEPVTSRFAEPDAMLRLDLLADCMANGGLVVGDRVAAWHHIDFATVPVTLTVNGETVVNQNGGHPSGDPLGAVVSLVQLNNGAKAGQIVTCGSYTGLRYLRPGDSCTARFEGLGEASITFMA